MAYDATAKRIGIRAVFDLKGSREDVSDWAGAALPKFPEEPNTRSEEGGCELMWTGREHWLFCAPLERESELLGLLKPDEAPASVSVALVSDVYEFFRLEGPDASAVVSVASPLDYRALPSNAATFTAAFGQKALFIPRGDAFEIAVENSYAAMFEGCFAAAVGAKPGVREPRLGSQPA